MKMKIKLGVSSVCSAFSHSAVGSRVLNHAVFKDAVATAIRRHDWADDRPPGQHTLHMGPSVNDLVSAGVGLTEGRSADDYVVRMHRGKADAYLRRHLAAEVESISVIVYTIEAYRADPEVDMAAEDFDDDVTHVIVAVLASAGPFAPRTAWRFTSNLSGGNLEALEWGADEIRAYARAVEAYWSRWCVVADGAA